MTTLIPGIDGQRGQRLGSASEGSAWYNLGTCVANA